MRTYEHAISGTGGPVPYTCAASNAFDVDELSIREQSVLLRVLLREHRSSLELRNEQTRMVVGAICQRIAQRPSIAHVAAFPPTTPATPHATPSPTIASTPEYAQPMAAPSAEDTPPAVAMAITAAATPVPVASPDAKPTELALTPQ